jgi:hypothetical protein
MEPIQLDEKGYKFLTIQEYKGRYRLEVGKPSKKDGKWYGDKIKTKHWNAETSQFEFSDKESNLAISIGDRYKTIEVLNKLLKELGGEESPF